ncbi:MAG: hypothetical protein ACK5O7_03805 [Holosporales bacterium]
MQCKTNGDWLVRLQLINPGGILLKTGIAPAKITDDRDLERLRQGAHESDTLYGLFCQRRGTGTLSDFFHDALSI